MSKKKFKLYLLVSCGYCEGGEVWITNPKHFHAIKPQPPKCQDCLLDENLIRAEAERNRLGRERLAKWAGRPA